MPSSLVGVCVKECDFILSGMYGLYFSREGCPPAQKTQLDSDLGKTPQFLLHPAHLLGEEGHATESPWYSSGERLPAAVPEHRRRAMGTACLRSRGADSEDPISLPSRVPASFTLNPCIPLLTQQSGLQARLLSQLSLGLLPRCSNANVHLGT